MKRRRRRPAKRVADVMLTFPMESVPHTFPSRDDEKVQHPSHYGGDVPHEVIKCLEAWGFEEDALLWNTVKYIARAGKKGDMLEDLEKAEFYLKRRIERLKEDDYGTTVETD